MDAIASNYEEAELSSRGLSLCRYAEKLTRRPAEMTREDLEPLRAEGLSDGDILDLVQVIGYFNYINRVADALGVPEEID